MSSPKRVGTLLGTLCGRVPETSRLVSQAVRDLPELTSQKLGQVVFPVP